MMDEVPRILIVDDNPAIHEDMTRVLLPCATDADRDVDQLAAELFGDDEEAPSTDAEYRIDHAFQGPEALAMVRDAQAGGDPYRMAFMDIRMPPGWDGIETIERVRGVAPDLQFVICSAYSDYTWSEIGQRVGHHDGLLVIRKPFDGIEVKQAASALTRKWELSRRVERHIAELSETVAARTAELRATVEQLELEHRERQRVESQLRLAQKLEAIGRLAAGVAHEINTPMQYVGDSVHFVKEAFDVIAPIIGHISSHPPGCDPEEVAFVCAELPGAMERAVEGLDRVKRIVSALRDMGHPDQEEKAPADVARILRNALVISRSEYKMLADVEADIGDVPQMPCHAGALGQAFLNLIVNAAHAIAERGHGRGRIGIRAQTDGDHIVVEVTDDGCGISADVQARMFDPFFTTKELGRGTGQGLSIVHSIIVERHGGSINCDSQVGRGTRMVIRLPIRRKDNR